MCIIVRNPLCIIGCEEFFFFLSLFAAALSVLRSSEEQAPVPQNKFMGDIEELAASYERKLIEVSAASLHSLLCISLFVFLDIQT